jgi:hypothetical protein
MAKKNNVIQENVPVTPTNDWINFHIYGFGQTQLNENRKQSMDRSLLTSTNGLTCPIVFRLQES